MREELEKLMAEHRIYAVLQSISPTSLTDRALGISTKNPPIISGLGFVANRHGD